MKIVNNPRPSVRTINVRGLEKLDKLSEDITLQDFEMWRAQWNDFCSINDLSSFPRAQQASALRMAMSMGMLQTVELVLGISPTSNHSPSYILDRIREHLRKKKSVAVDRLQFEQCNQLNETFDQYFIRLKRIAACADLCHHCYEERLTTRLIAGISDAEARKKLLAKEIFPSLKSTVDLCRAEESANTNEPLLNRPSHSGERPVNKLTKEAQGPKDEKKDGRNRSWSRNRERGNDSKCGKCGYYPHGKDQECPAKGKECNACGKTGHFSSVCRSSGKASQGSSGQPSATNVGTIRVYHLPDARRQVPTVNVDILGKRGDLLTVATAVPDSGAEATIISLKVLHQIGIDINNVPYKGQDMLIAANGLSVDSAGRLELQIRYRSVTVNTTVIVCPEHDGMLISWHTSRDLGFLPKNYPEPIVSSVNTVSISAPRSLPPGEIAAGQIPEIRELILKEFSDVFRSSGELPMMSGPPIKIELRPDAVPYSINGARPIPFAQRDTVKKMLDDMMQQGIIAPVTGPTEWCHPLVVAPKSNGKLRLCVDLTKLNRHVKRPYYPLTTPKDAVSNVRNTARFFTTFDATNGYWQVPLDKDSQKLTTFVTQWGRFQFLRGTMGLICTGDEYCRRMDESLASVPNLIKVVDDLLQHGDDLTSHVHDVWKLLVACREHRITLNPEKAHLFENSVNFAGYVLDGNGITPDPAKVDAIAQFPRPTNITELRSFMGLVVQLADFSADISATAGPLRPLLRTAMPFVWTDEHESAFIAVKKALVSPPILSTFDPAAETVLQTDASRKNGLGFALLQKHDNHWRLIQAGSRFLIEAEARYATIELELCGVVWAMKKCRLYLLGLPHFTLIVDHQPLVTILDKYSLDAVENPRLQRLKERTSPFIFTTIWKKGKEHALPDALSRAPVSNPSADDLVDETATQQSVKFITAFSVAAIFSEQTQQEPHLVDPLLVELRDAGAADPAYKKLINIIEDGFPRNPESLDKDIRQYWGVREHLSVDDGLVLYGSRIVVPASRRSDVLTRLHSSHQGIERTKRRARQTVYWPGLTSDITNTIRSCDLCQRMLPSAPQEPMELEPEPSRIFEDVSVDLFSIGDNNYLIYADRYSGWPTVSSWMGKSPTSRDVIGVLKKNFVDLGIPVRLRSDGGGHFTSAAIDAFFKQWGVSQVFSTPHYPQSNGHAESAVKAMKHLLIKAACNGKIDSDAFSQGILEWRNTPRVHGLSPAMMLFGHPIRSIVPVHHSSFGRKWTEMMDLRDRVVEREKNRSKQRYDATAHPLRSFPVGAKVRIQDHVSKRWDKTGVVISIGKHRDCRVKLPSGRVYWRNRRFLKPDYSGEAEPKRPSVSISPTPTEIETPDRPNENREQSSYCHPKQPETVQPQRRSGRIRKKNPRYFD